MATTDGLINADEWITGREAAKRLGVARYHTIAKVADASGIRRLVIPGRRVKYHASDVAAVAKASVVGTGPARPKRHATSAAAG